MPAGESSSGSSTMTEQNSAPYDDDVAPVLAARLLGLQTQGEAIVLMRSDCPVCRSEGLGARARILLQAGDREVFATLYQTQGEWLAPGEAGLSDAAAERLGIGNGDLIGIRHPPPLQSLADVRRRVHGNRLHGRAFRAIIEDMVAGRYVDIDLATFIAACSAFPLDRDEMTHLTQAMVASGEQLRWDWPVVVDKHCIGGLPGNRTTPILVAIAAELGLHVPKTSSRAITSPAGTADMMETLTNVTLDTATMRRVVKEEGGCLAWGGAMHLSPADDLLIRVERALDLDPEGQMVASILSKKVAAGSTHVLIDIPVGPTAKVRTKAAAQSLAGHLEWVGSRLGLNVRCILTDGLQPVGRGIGPALEARDVLMVLENHPDAPADLRDRALALSGDLLELAGAARQGQGFALARAVLDDGRALARFRRICASQGGLRTPPVAAWRADLPAANSGILCSLDNRRLSRLAKLAGAPDEPAAGVDLQVRLGDPVEQGAPLLTIHAESRGGLAYALDYARSNPGIFGIEA
jgi:thymidine phosphorylase